MYNVFFNDSLIIIASSADPRIDAPSLPFEGFQLEKVIQQMNKENIKKLVLLSDDFQKDWQCFLEQIQVVPAAGGLVTNNKEEVLFIFRHGIWDLPKGRIEENENEKTAAIREVEEECGIYELQLKEKLMTTYHIYYHNNYKLKETHWYLMHSDYTKKLIPQTEEGITEVGFKTETEIKRLFKNTYANIQLVYDTYKNKRSSKK